jgi:trans-aconitate methyltransferase
MSGWDAQAYDERFGYVTEYGTDLVAVLDPQPGEWVLDLGCGTGHLTARIAEAGAHAEGLDADPAMIDRARHEHHGIAFRLADARTFTVAAPFDAVFSNAALHWVAPQDQGAVLRQVRAALRPGGRFVAEMGGAGNVAHLVAAADRACDELRLARVAHPWSFPTPQERGADLAAAGFEVRSTQHFPRPTPLADGDGAGDWFRMFGRWLLDAVPAERHDELLAAIDRLAAPALRGADGRWTADYVRLRWTAVAVGS